MDCSFNNTAIPEEYVCPITMSVMKNPMRHNETGHCFEREAVMNWIYQGNTKCPLTRKSLHPDDMALDTELQAKIEAWKMENSELSQSRCDFDDSADFESTFNDILEITNRIKSITVDQQRRHSAPMLSLSSKKEEKEAAPVARTSLGSSRLTDLRMKVLQRRDDRIKTMLSKEDPSQGLKVDTTTDLSLAGLMAARV
ncbi:Putative E3 ubiquitin-protein ligase LIN [Seminavis robusta]|uniref:E3 ubiquitin-protein ligase LIN n=1 Tax=Seminavis robusta TaxID=568900 RepID=A0A9N8D5V2_9STRA|nr:Putative E3 ubiquitin-protein ligase LIN [Seminavis robusta]|eukprot:Sro12_g009310.1 Putative E3 ubiquitin-protein ligase LIN (198) ;mRNA; r:84233-84826